MLLSQTMNWIIEHWPKATLPLAAYTAVYLGLFVFPADPNIFWIWLQIPLYWIHQFEKHLFPGGIASFVNVRVLGSSDGDRPLTARRTFWASVPLPWIAFPVSAILADRFGAEYGLWIAYYSVLEGAAQLAASWVWFAISPGVVTSSLLTLPIGAVTIRTFHKVYPLPTYVHVIALEVAILCHGAVLIWVLKFLRAEVTSMGMESKQKRRRRQRRWGGVDDSERQRNSEGLDDV